jgi:perosamine synthetase
MIVSNDENMAQKIRKFAGIGYKHMTAETGRTSLAMSTVQDPDYERFDTLGLNYRMTEVSAAIGLAQFERIESMVSRRQAVAKIFDEAVGDCDWMVCQKVPEGYVHAHYTYTVKYYGEEKHGVSWKQFYNQYKEMGGDGFYGACKVPYLEPVFNDLEINGVRYGKGLCPVAEEIQPRIMQFKTNYKNLEVAKEKADILNRLINKIGK